MVDQNVEKEEEEKKKGGHADKMLITAWCTMKKIRFFFSTS